MSDVKRLFGFVIVTVAVTAIAIMVFGREVGAGTVRAAQGSQEELQLPTGSGASEWQKIEEQLSGEFAETKLMADDAQDGDAFGWQVAISGDTAVVGAPYENGGPGDPFPYAGAAYVFERNEGGINNWGQVTRLTPDTIDSNRYFGYPVAIGGNTIVVGAGNEDSGPDGAGAAYVFERDQGGSNNWGQVKKLTASDPGFNDFFGDSLAISDDIIVVGAYSEDGGAGDPMLAAGAAYIYERNQGGANNWGEVIKLTASDAQEYDLFGTWVAIEDDTLLVGAPGEDGGSGDPLSWAGAAYIFERNQGGANNWGEVVKLTASDAQDDDNFGVPVVISGDTVFVGASFEDGGSGDPEPDAGAVYIYERDQGGANNWGEVVKLTASDAQSEDYFGTSMAISNDTLFVGAPGESGGTGDPLPVSGVVYAFDRDQGGAGNWGEIGKLTASDIQADDAFGISVAISGGTLLVGAAGEDGGPGDPLPDAGAAYVFWHYEAYVPVVIRP
ncbi:MAG: FG-GAP repeat protein [Candidatus Promineifilaceae bacterium]